ncbi:MAG: cyclic nucleotide-binding domain-containing protein [Spirochaetaceae bacterium]|jgi:CRP-like cAMP-binding protein|nr:cyclic nucleotide-binding domain-containing protein [Spirochaetaceae bacterium]
MVESTTLQKYSLFGGLMTDQIDRILPLLEQETFSPGEFIVTEGAPNDRIRFILEGRVVVLGKGILLTEFGEGDEFGEMEVLEVMPSAATIKALTPTRVLSISNRSLRQIYKDDTPSFALIIMNLARDLSRRLRRMNERVIPAETGTPD